MRIRYKTRCSLCDGHTAGGVWQNVVDDAGLRTVRYCRACLEALDFKGVADWMGKPRNLRPVFEVFGR